MASTFEYWRSKRDHRYWFHLVEQSGNEVIVSSTTGYKTEQECINSITAARINARFHHQYSKYEGNDKKFYFTLRAGIHEPACRSEAYNTAYQRDQGLDACKKEAPYAEVQPVKV